MQVSCLAQMGEDGKNHEAAPAAKFPDVALAAARARPNFWLGIEADDRLAPKYSLPMVKGAVKLDGVDPRRAKAFFRDWLDDMIAGGGENLIPAVAIGATSAITSPPHDVHPTACHDVPVSE